MTNFEDWCLQPKWFSEASPTNPHQASINIGAGANGVIAIKYDAIGTAGNDYTLEAVAGAENNDPLAVTLTDKKITITLGKDGIGGISVTTNTAILVAEAISALDGFTATHSGSGVTPLGAVIAETSLTGGSFGTPCPQKNTLVYATPYYYLCAEEGNDVDVAWKRFTPATY